MAVVPYCCSFAGASRCPAELRTAGPAPTCPTRCRVPQRGRRQKPGGGQGSLWRPAPVFFSQADVQRSKEAVGAEGLHRGDAGGVTGWKLSPAVSAKGPNNSAHLPF